MDALTDSSVAMDAVTDSEIAWKNNIMQSEVAKQKIKNNILSSNSTSNETKMFWDDEEQQGYIIEAFKNTGEGTWAKPEMEPEKVDVLVVGGGGGGGSGSTVCSGNWYSGGGGGAGGLIFEKELDVSSAEEINIKVGGGGDGAESQKEHFGEQGENSRFEASEIDDIEAIGGGPGETRYGANDTGTCSGGPVSTMDGGSGGGRSDEWSDRAGEGIDGQGYDGGVGGDEVGGGGGGATQPGEDGNEGNSSIGGDGGDGLYKGDVFGSEFGESGYFAGGGGGGGSIPFSDSSRSDGTGVGGIGGGGDGNIGDSNNDNGRPGNDAMSNTGGGGGGAGGEDGDDEEDSHGGDGGSGIVLVRYTF